MSKRRMPVQDAAAAAAAPRTLIEQAYVRLRDDIVEGRLAPGQKLRIEHLRACYGVGAGTLREALTRLVSDALVQAEGQRGFRVAPMSLDDLADLTELRLHIELDALRQSIRYGGTAWRDALRAAYGELSACPVTPEHRKRWEALNTRFHEVLISGRRSPWTLRVWRVLARHGERYRSQAIALHAAQGRDVDAEHRQIFEAAIEGNEARAALALEAHIRATLDLLARTDRLGIGTDATPALPASAGDRF
ncbi:phosphonate utilization associated transcriptional regulator [Tepidimonas thermarum]|uniref:Phosphonate utilization associated transcriptional regulator n=1 Tax=Tepidimonas thermarum TaxID=335431 RepID=A0A554WZ36_9BURK|nr:GntR family transcriptional regulator [Tepidimonas thermarum]TSE28834.1 phosphonate utilization associated transcriptional regulator [Tepidimonas thermarum]